MDVPELILSSDLARLGQDARDLARKAKSGQLRRNRQGVYVRAQDWEALAPWDRYPLLIRAAAATLKSRTVFCRQSSGVLWDMPVLGLQRPVHACTSDAGGGRSRAGVRRHFVDLVRRIRRPREIPESGVPSGPDAGAGSRRREAPGGPDPCHGPAGGPLYVV